MTSTATGSAVVVLGAAAADMAVPSAGGDGDGITTAVGEGNVAGAASVLVAALEGVWAAIVDVHPEVPSVVIVVAAGSGGRRAGELKLGHFAAGRWEVVGHAQAEVLVGGEGLRRGADDVLGTLLHEAAHGLATARGVQDCSRGGRYHNRRYAALAAELGLDVAQDGPRGWSSTTVREATAGIYAGVVEELTAALVLWRRAEGDAGAGGQSRNPKACRCGCGRRIRAAESTLAEAPIVCGRCDTEFEAEP